MRAYTASGREGDRARQTERERERVRVRETDRKTERETQRGKAMRQGGCEGDESVEESVL